MSSVKIQLETLLVRRGFGSVIAPAMCAETPPEITELVPKLGVGAGITSLALRMAAQTRGKVAWVDAGDALDPESATRAGLQLDQLLWVRAPGAHAAALLEATFVLTQSGAFALVVLDVLDLEARRLRIPRSAWFRLLRGLERGRRTRLLVLAPYPLTAGCAGQVIAVRRDSLRWNRQAAPLLEGARVSTQVEKEKSPKKPVASVTHLDLELAG